MVGLEQLATFTEQQAFQTVNHAGVTQNARQSMAGSASAGHALAKLAGLARAAASSWVQLGGSIIG